MSYNVVYGPAADDGERCAIRAIETASPAAASEAEPGVDTAQDRPIAQSFLALVEERRLDQLETMIDLGSQFFVKAFVPDLSKICLDIGFGFHAPLTSSEALEFLQEKLRLLTSNLDRYRQTEQSVQAHIDAIENELNKWRAMAEIEQAQSTGRLI